MSSSDDDAFCQPTDDNIPIIEPELWELDLLILQDPSEVIQDISDYLKCFDSTLGGKVTIYTDQPENNSPKTHVGTEVGHTFISIQQGSKTRVFGYYPDGGVYPLIQPGADPLLVNDSGHDYDVKIEINVDRNQMKSVIDAAKGFGNTSYHLSNYNCTDFAFAISQGAGVSLPDTYGSWPGGGGSNPGSLGQDLRNMPASTKYSVSTVSGNGASNSGSCG